MLSAAMFPPASSCWPKGGRKPRTVHRGLWKSSRKVLTLGLKKEKGGPGVWKGQESPAPAYSFFFAFLCPSSQEVLWRQQWQGRLVRDPKLHRRDLSYLTWWDQNSHASPSVFAAWPWKQKELALLWLMYFNLQTAYMLLEYSLATLISKCVLVFHVQNKAPQLQKSPFQRQLHLALL